jgi:AcrR family transcriptional regulator
LIDQEPTPSRVSELARKGPRESGRRKVLLAAAIAFQERGYDGTSIDDIADVMDATKGRVYYYYRSKQAIYLDTRIAALELLADTVRRARDGADSPQARLEAMVLDSIALSYSHRALIRVILGGHFVNLPINNTPDLIAAAEHIERVRFGIEDMFREVVEEGIAAGVVRCVDPGAAAMTCMAAATSVVLWRPGLFDHAPEMAADVASIVVGGLLA